MAGLFASLVGSLGGKHLLPAVRSLPAADPDSSDDESVPLGLGLRSDVATGSSQKRRRVHHRGASPLASHGQVGRCAHCSGSWRLSDCKQEPAAAQPR